ncbi:uncharacterized protein SPSK_03602 [Sporothrix schenckii 1099-18]|uniref:Uncharacterized protein n=1 Tax=Sporothrix schenckii 1099-18 TaxID=1397361 RepID=A0A0F2LYW0_SPOSC|nr:uncharacterized protein SPSK_03602 [Sporothrix schenckii 1099-18]KJR82648.1 hypothetical protein SPSK_03602 [Sporothrix schenckii 1099-18]
MYRSVHRLASVVHRSTIRGAARQQQSPGRWLSALFLRISNNSIGTKTVTVDTVSNTVVFLLVPVQLLTGKPNSPVQSHREAPVSTTDHQSIYNLGCAVPASTDGVCPDRDAYGNAYAATCRDNLEYDVENAVGDWVDKEMGCLNRGDDQHRKHHPPEVMRKLAMKLMTDEAKAAFCAVSFIRRRCNAHPVPRNKRPACNAGEFVDERQSSPGRDA